MFRQKIRAAVLMSCTAIIATSRPALANDSAQANSPLAENTPQSSGGLEEIIVTARKQAESLLSVPVTASALTSTDLSKFGITDVSSVGMQIPSVNFDKTLGASNGGLTIRGIGSSTLDTGIEGAVSTVIDGVQTSRGTFIQTGLLDAAQIEVLKGPQALFFGKNSPGGVLSIRSNAPTDHLTGYLRTGYEFRANEKIIEGVISGPLSDVLRARAAFRVNDIDGWTRNVAQSVPNPFFGAPGNGEFIVAPPYKRNASQDVAGRFALEYRPVSDFTATLRLLGNKYKNRGPSSDAEIFACPNQHPDTLGVFDPAADCVINNRQSLGPIPPQVAASDPIFRDGVPYGRYHAFIASLTLDYATDDVDITAVSGYMEYRARKSLSNNTVYNYPAVGYDEKFRQISQELRAVTAFDGPVNFSGGVYFEDIKFFAYTATSLFPGLPDTRTGSYLSYTLETHNTAQSYSAFAQARINVTDSLEISGGGRYSHDVRKGATGNTFVSDTLPFPLATEGFIFSRKKSYNNFSPELTVSWRPAERTLIFGSYREGYKAGSASAVAIVPGSFSADDALFYGPEKIKGFEIGAKVETSDNRLRVTAAAFTYKYTDLQINNFDSTRFENTALNVGGLRTKGAEVEASYVPIHGLRLSGGVGYARARYTFFPGIACYPGQAAAEGCDVANNVQDLTGQRKFRSPDWTGNARFDYEQPIGDYLVSLSGSMRFSSFYLTQENNNPLARQGSYQIYDASLRFGPSDERWQLALIGRNLSDKQYVVASIDNPNSLPGTIEGQISRPRQIMLEATIRY